MFTYLLDFIKTASNEEKKSISIILVNLTLASKRELKKMITSGIV